MSRALILLVVVMLAGCVSDPCEHSNRGVRDIESLITECQATPSCIVPIQTINARRFWQREVAQDCKKVEPA